LADGDWHIAMIVERQDSYSHAEEALTTLFAATPAFTTPGESCASQRRPTLTRPVRPRLPRPHGRCRDASGRNPAGVAAGGGVAGGAARAAARTVAVKWQSVGLVGVGGLVVRLRAGTR
jgi:hypothetical protein